MFKLLQSVSSCSVWYQDTARRLLQSLWYLTPAIMEKTLFSQAEGRQPVAWLMTVTEENLLEATCVHPEPRSS